LWGGGGDLREEENLQNLGVDRRLMLQRFFKKRDGRALTGLLWLMIGTVEGLL